jgi:hypothetical protein
VRLRTAEVYRCLDLKAVICGTVTLFKNSKILYLCIHSECDDQPNMFQYNLAFPKVNRDTITDFIKAVHPNIRAVIS